MRQKKDYGEREAIEREANALYDKLNPQPDVKINVSKVECLRRAEWKLSKSGRNKA